MKYEGKKAKWDSSNVNQPVLPTAEMNWRRYAVESVVPNFYFGDGAPYAPSNWPEEGDVWGWRVERKCSTKGFYTDRYFLTPVKYWHRHNRKRESRSKSTISAVLRDEFSSWDAESFWSSFSWEVPGSGSSDVNGQADGDPEEGSEEGAREIPTEIVEEGGGEILMQGGKSDVQGGDEFAADIPVEGGDEGGGDIPMEAGGDDPLEGGDAGSGHEEGDNRGGHNTERADKGGVTEPQSETPLQAKTRRIKELKRRQVLLKRQLELEMAEMDIHTGSVARDFEGEAAGMAGVDKGELADKPTVAEPSAEVATEPEVPEPELPPPPAPEVVPPPAPEPEVPALAPPTRQSKRTVTSRYLDRRTRSARLESMAVPIGFFNMADDPVLIDDPIRVREITFAGVMLRGPTFYRGGQHCMPGRAMIEAIDEALPGVTLPEQRRALEKKREALTRQLEEKRRRGKYKNNANQLQ